MKTVDEFEAEQNLQNIHIATWLEQERAARTAQARRGPERMLSSLLEDYTKQIKSDKQ